MSDGPEDEPQVRGLRAVEAEPEDQRRIATTDPLEVQAMRLFAQRYEEKYRYNHTRGKWMEWTGFRWQYDDLARAKYEMIGLVDRMRMQDPANRRSLGKIGFSNSALSGAQSHPELAVGNDHFDTDPYLVGTPTGYIDLRTGSHHKPDRSKMISKALAVAPARTSKCPKWRKFILWACGGDEELRDYLHKFLGYCLSGLMCEEIMTFIYGPGGNGKGVMMSALAHILGDYYVNTPASTFMDTKKQEHATELARLDGGRLVSASETGEDDKWNLSRIKEITGNENPITARFMRQDFFEFWPVCKLLIIGNNKPEIGEVDPAIARRLRLIEFTQRPDKADLTLKDRMAAEYGGILQWMVEGFQKYQKEGLEPPERVVSASAAYLSSQDVTNEFIKNTMEFSPKGRLLRKDVGWALFAYLRENGHAKAVKAPKVYKKLEQEHGLPKDDWYQGARAFHGVNIRPEFWEVMKRYMGENQAFPDADGLRGVPRPE